MLVLTGFSVVSAGPQSEGNLKEVIYLSDTLVKTDGKSLIFGVAIDQVGGRVNLTFPRAGGMV